MKNNIVYLISFIVLIISYIIQRTFQNEKTTWIIAGTIVTVSFIVLGVLGQKIYKEGWQKIVPWMFIFAGIFELISILLRILSSNY